MLSFLARKARKIHRDYNAFCIQFLYPFSTLFESISGFLPSTTMLFLAAIFPLTAPLTPISSQQNFANPIIYSDFADNYVFRGPDGAYYFSGSSFQFSPGAPILKSYDLTSG